MNSLRPQLARVGQLKVKAWHLPLRPWGLRGLVTHGRGSWRYAGHDTAKCLGKLRVVFGWFGVNVFFRNTRNCMNCSFDWTTPTGGFSGGPWEAPISMRNFFDVLFGCTFVWGFQSDAKGERCNTTTGSPRLWLDGNAKKHGAGGELQKYGTLWNDLDSFRF